LHEKLSRGGVPSWSGAYSATLALLALTAMLASYNVARRFADVRSAHLGALGVWAVVALVASVAAPGASYLFTWPLVFACAAAVITSRRRAVIEIAQWAAAAVTLLLLAGLAYTTAAVMLGLRGAGGIVLAVFAALIAWLLVPLLDRVIAGARWSGAGWPLAAAVVTAIIGATTVRRSDAHPSPSFLAYALDADSSNAWLVTTSAASRNPWTEVVMGSAASTLPTSAWASRLFGSTRAMIGRPAPRTAQPAPSASLLADSTSAGQRHVTLRITAPPGTTAVDVRVYDAPVLASAIDGRAVDTTRYRQRSSRWTMRYWAVPDSGMTVSLTVGAPYRFELELFARRPGLPDLADIPIAPRPDDVVPVQFGDVTVVRRRMRF
jgi:hypothetical protein